MKKYTKAEYLKYVKSLEKDKKLFKDERPISFEKWQIFQPIADRVVGKVNKVIKRGLEL